MVEKGSNLIRDRPLHLTFRLEWSHVPIIYSKFIQYFCNSTIIYWKCNSIYDYRQRWKVHESNNYTILFCILNNWTYVYNNWIYIFKKKLNDDANSILALSLLANIRKTFFMTVKQHTRTDTLTQLQTITSTRRRVTNNKIWDISAIIYLYEFRR